jgi:hypothetical protein
MGNTRPKHTITTTTTIYREKLDSSLPLSPVDEAVGEKGERSQGVGMGETLKGGLEREERKK